MESMRQQRVLDVAAERPDAPMAEIADEIPSATVELVERVFEQYGDPAETDGDPADGFGPTPSAEGPRSSPTADPTGSAGQADEQPASQGRDAGQRTAETHESSTTAGNSQASGTAAQPEARADEMERSDTSDDETPVAPGDEEATGEAEDGAAAPQSVSETTALPDREELTPVQRETLRAIHRYPEASQRELAAHLGISAASVCRRIDLIFRLLDDRSESLMVICSSVGPRPCRPDDSYTHSPDQSCRHTAEGHPERFSHPFSRRIIWLMI